MAIRLPSLAATHCKSLIVCVDVQTDDKRLLRWLGRQPRIIVRYGVGKESTYAYASFGEGNTFHIDLATKAFFKGEHPPADRAKLSDFQAAVERLEGLRIDAKIEGYFEIPKDRLPPIIRSAKVATKAGDVSIETAAGTFIVRGAPIYLINWYDGPGENVLVHLVARRATTIDAEYLESALDLVETAFTTLVRGGQQNV